MDVQYGQFAMINWLWLVIAIAIVAFVAIGLHQRALASFATPNLLRRMVSGNQINRNLVSAGLTVLALIFLVVALVDIRWGRAWQEVPQRGIEIIFALDVSRSMLAEDAAPNRLARAKQYIKDIVDEMEGDRAGLVLFAGDVKRHVPLTNHYDDFKQTLNEVGPHNVDRGGSILGQAIRTAGESFLEERADHKAIVLITDGEDHESKPIEAAKFVHRKLGVRIFTVGLGDYETGSRIPIQGSRQNAYVQHNGMTVVSRLNGDTLEEIATVSDGAYIPAGTKQVDMGAVYHRFIRAIDQRDFESTKINAYIPRYPWFLGTALILLLIDSFLSQLPHKRLAKTTHAFENFEPADAA